MIGELVHFKKKKILVVGDFMLDTYTRGSVKRISPEAPVCVLKVEKEDKLPGGAGNVALNVQALGCSVSLLGRIGEDKASRALLEAFKEQNIDTSGLILEEGFETPLKNRILAQHQQLLRIDFETDSPILKQTEKSALSYYQKHLQDFDLVLVSDYAKGFLSKSLLSEMIAFAQTLDKPVFVDPKGQDFTKYKNATLIKPNRYEAYVASGSDEKASIEEVGQKLLDLTECEYLLITRSEKGMTLFQQDNAKEEFPALAKEVVDVTGAGDTVLATLAVAYASGLELSSAIKVANIAASLAIEKIGCAHIGKKELWQAVMQNEVQYKYLPYLGEEGLKLLFIEERFILYPFNIEKIHWELLEDLEELKLRHPHLKIAAVVSEDLEGGIVRNICSLKQLDLVLPEGFLHILSALVEHSNLA